MADLGKTRENFPGEKRTSADLDDLTTRDESELYDQDDVETSAADRAARESRVAEIRSNYRPRDSEVRDDAGQIRLFSEFEVSDFRSRWNDVQTGFVDSPRHAVEQADQLVATMMERITNSFAQERSSLEKHWDRGDHVSTEDLRVALQRYREFFGRLLNAA